MENLSRRKFLGLSAAAAAIAMVPGTMSFPEAPKKKKQIDSKFAGVQVGAITYSWRSMPSTAEDILKYCIADGIGSIELMGDVAENYAGLPKSTPEEQKKWRLSAPMDKYKELKKMYNDDGVKIHIVKFSPGDWSDGEIEYAFKAAKTLGAIGVSNEIGDEACKRMGPVAMKNGMFAVFHQHLQPGEPGWTFEKFLEYSPAVMLNMDVGHYFGATGKHPNEVIEKLHDRIVSIHLKDKTGQKGNPPNTNMPWGKGETPIADILRLIRKHKWPIEVDIELEYPVPEGSDAVAEVKKCVEYCRRILD
jgi:sugar phosphate isomerase/epimerase